MIIRPTGLFALAETGRYPGRAGRFGANGIVSIRRFRMGLQVQRTQVSLDKRRIRLKPLITAVLVLTMAAGVAAAADAHAGQAMYEKSCKACHGNEGQGNPGLAKAMGVTIPDLRSSEVQSKTDAQLKKVIAEGKGKMRPVASISADQAQDIIAYIRTLAKK